MNNKMALEKAYAALAPYSKSQQWEFNNMLVHLNFITEKIKKGSTIFDAGCGIGILDIALSILGYTVEGGDKYLFIADNPYYVAERSNLENIWNTYGVKITEKDMLTDELDKKYDVILSIATIEHQKAPKEFLMSMVKNLNSSGLLYVATPNPTHMLNRLRFLCGYVPLGNLKSFFEAGENFTGHWREYALYELKQFYNWLELDIVETRNLQSIRPKFKFKNPRDIYVNLFRVLSYILPGCRDTNIILGKKR